MVIGAILLNNKDRHRPKSRCCYRALLRKAEVSEIACPEGPSAHFFRTHAKFHQRPGEEEARRSWQRPTADYS